MTYMPALCKDCGVNTFDQEGDYYMVTPNIWNEYGLGGSYYTGDGWSEDEPSGMLCMRDLERRMGRKLRISDLMEVPLNDYWFFHLNANVCGCGKHIGSRAKSCKSCANSVSATARHKKGHFGFVPGMKMRLGKRMPPESVEIIKKKLRGRNSGSSSPFWVGDKVKYRGLHNWVERTLGKPDSCEHCPRKGLSGHQIHWANKSGRYLRDVSDWIRLCAKCHSKYDNVST